MEDTSLEQPNAPERHGRARVLVALFVTVFLALVLIAATTDPYGAGCGGG